MALPYFVYFNSYILAGRNILKPPEIYPIPWRLFHFINYILFRGRPFYDYQAFFRKIQISLIDSI